MRIVGLLVVVLLALAACRGPCGEDPWCDKGWVSEDFDYETEFWEPACEATPKPAPCPTPCAPARPAVVQRTPAPRAPTGTAPRAPGMQPTAPATPRGSYGVPPPPPPPYELPR